MVSDEIGIFLFSDHGNLSETIIKLIESSRNETHLVLQRGYKNFYQFYRPSIDLFYNNFFRISSRNYQHEMKNNLEELFRNILRLTIGMNDEKKLIPPSYFLCLWRHHPFGNRPNIIANRLEINLGKLFHFNELLKLSLELIQVMSTVCLVIDVEKFLSDDRFDYIEFDILQCDAAEFVSLSISLIGRVIDAYIKFNECNSMLRLQKDRKSVACIIKR